ncbi:hypothetical protein FRC01_007184 [Tulasnella sp. 417]|nr:hypothetical protein FRC01_007184 [Tulasnella sp. 417]
MPANKGDVLVVPAPNDKHKTDGNKITIHWQQRFSQREGYVEVPFYIQSEWYNEPGFNSAHNMFRIDDDNYEITLDDRHQYPGGSSALFVAWHDKERRPFAEHFIQTSIFKQGANLAKQVFRCLQLNVTPTDQAIERIGE